MAKRRFLIAVLAVMGLFSVCTIGCAAVTEQTSVVSGVVAAEGLVQEGTAVQQGDVLVNVKSLAGGNIAAARATVSGRVVEVFVTPGQKIDAQQVVAKISE